MRATRFISSRRRPRGFFPSPFLLRSSALFSPLNSSALSHNLCSFSSHLPQIVQIPRAPLNYGMGKLNLPLSSSRTIFPQLISHNATKSNFVRSSRGITQTKVKHNMWSKTNFLVVLCLIWSLFWLVIREEDQVAWFNSTAPGWASKRRQRTPSSEFISTLHLFGFYDYASIILLIYIISS